MVTTAVSVTRWPGAGTVGVAVSLVVVRPAEGVVEAMVTLRGEDVLAENELEPL
jgi:hypothetical protein